MKYKIQVPSTESEAQRRGQSSMAADAVLSNQIERRNDQL